MATDNVKMSMSEGAAEAKAWSFTFTPEMMEKLQAQVDLPGQGSLHQFTIDALNTYLHLGQLKAQSGGKFLFEADGRDTPIVLHLPFELSARDAV